MYKYFRGLIKSIPPLIVAIILGVILRKTESNIYVVFFVSILYFYLSYKYLKKTWLKT